MDRRLELDQRNLLAHRDTRREHRDRFLFFSWVSHVEQIDNGERLAKQNLRQNENRRNMLEEALNGLKMDRASSEVDTREIDRQLTEAIAMKTESDDKLNRIKEDLEKATKKLKDAEDALNEGFQNNGVRTVEHALEVENLVKHVTNVQLDLSNGISEMRDLIDSIKITEEGKFSGSLRGAMKLIAFNEGVRASSSSSDPNERNLFLQECRREASNRLAYPALDF
jgi:hypothetical protein